MQYTVTQPGKKSVLYNKIESLETGLVQVTANTSL